MSEESDDASKTEEPTAKKLDEARKQGQVARSQEMNILFGFIGAGLVLAFLAPSMMQRIMDLLVPFIQRPHDMTMSQVGLADMFISLIIGVVLVLALPMLIFLIAGILPSLLQFGLLFSAESIKPKFSKISPLAGLKKMFSMRQLVEFLKGLVKIAVVGTIATLILWPEFRDLEIIATQPFDAILDRIYWMAIKLVMAVLFIMILVAGLDYAFQRYTFMKEQRMTKQEVKEEAKQQEGDPLVKGRIRQIRMERARRRMMAAVPQADVVVTNPTHYAVALQYDNETMGAPRVVAKGADELAMRIRQVAEDNEVPIVENPPVARALHASCDLEDEIPAEHYKAVAEIISYVYRLKNRNLRPRPA